MSSQKLSALANITLPSTPLIVAADDFVKRNVSVHTYRHSVRSAYWALLLAQKLPQFSVRGLRVELVTYACIMHDIGWTANEQLISKDKRFEVDSANIAVDFAKGNKSGWDDRTLQDLWAMIALHSTSSLAQHWPVPEVHLVHLGIISDFFGPNLPPPFPSDLISTQTYKDVIRTFPVGGFKHDLVKTMCSLCRSKMQTTFDTVVGDFGQEFGFDGKGGGREDYIREKKQSNMTMLILDALENCESLQD